MSVPSNSRDAMSLKLFMSAFIPHKFRSCWAITGSTSTLVRLSSMTSKQHKTPENAKPLKNLNTRASAKPNSQNMMHTNKAKSGTIMATGRDKAARTLP
eukprot:4020158-Amphidinium_carterae.1